MEAIEKTFSPSAGCRQVTGKLSQPKPIYYPPKDADELGEDAVASAESQTSGKNADPVDEDLIIGALINYSQTTAAEAEAVKHEIRKLEGRLEALLQRQEDILHALEHYYRMEDEADA